jgi:sporulation protein YlmC with PRC-barrel domain
LRKAGQVVARYGFLGDNSMSTMAPTEHRLVLAASNLIGDEVENLQGEDLGHIKELMIDMQSGRVAYAVVSFGGILGIGDKLFAVPWPALRLNHQNGVFILDVAKRRLEEAPGFDKDHWPDMADVSWSDKIERYFGTAPQRYDG